MMKANSSWLKRTLAMLLVVVTLIGLIPTSVIAAAAESLRSSSYIPGDVNGDGEVNALDVNLLRCYIVGGYDVTINTLAADVNADGEMVELVNPEIIDQKGEQDGLEGCLSVPGRRGTVERPEKVRVRFQDRKGRLCELEGDGILGMCICHETDHLDGIVYIDKMIEDVTDQYETEAEDEE